MMRSPAGVLAAVLVLGLVRSAGAVTLPGPVVGEPAPAFDLVTTAGRRARLSDYRGKTLVINVWGSWCPPCRLETPDLVAEAKAGAANGVAFLGVDTTESASAVRAFAATKGVPYPQVATTGESAFARDYDIRNYPTTFVIDPGGVLRARHADNLLPRAQLQAYIAAAQRGASAPLVSAFQKQLDTLLAPANYAFAGDPQTIRANVARAAQAIESADDQLDDAMDDAARDHDLIATQAEEETLRAAAIAAFAPIASGDADGALLATLRGDEAAALGRWSAADEFYAAAHALAPDDVRILAADAYAVSHLGDDARVVRIDEQIAAARPATTSLVRLAQAQAKTGDVASAELNFARAQTLAADAPATLAWTNLYDGRMEAGAHDASRARAAFTRALAAAQRIPPANPRAAWYIEQAQEGMVALGVVAGAPPSLSLAPWTGADLPGSVASTIKYRLVATAAPGAKLTLAAGGLPKHWIGSFCTDRVCSPLRVEFTMPADGVKLIEFQVVPLVTAARATTVRIDATEGTRRVASVTAAVGA